MSSFLKISIFCFLYVHNKGFILEDYPSCGIPSIQPKTKRIIGGTEAIPGSWPWMVLLTNHGNASCGGSILNERIVLTAAHCFPESTFEEHPSKWQLYVGKHHIHMQDPTEFAFDLHRVVIHPQFDKNTLENDLALLYLSHDIPFSDYVRPICLPPEDIPVAAYNDNCYITGWGETRGTGNETVLNQAVVPIIHPYWCSRPDWYGSQFYKDISFCAGYKSGIRDACKGDSGGPLACESGGRWYVQGVTSWGRDCGQPHWPGIYVNVSVYTEWIRNTANHMGYSIFD